MKQSRPKIEPVPAGICGAIAAALVAYIFRFLVYPDPDPTMRATIIATALRFALPWLYFWNLHRKYHDARLAII
jgi:hypothetical protein